jgi:hypothetical protein
MWDKPGRATANRAFLLRLLSEYLWPHLPYVWRCFFNAEIVFQTFLLLAVTMLITTLIQLNAGASFRLCPIRLRRGFRL